MLCHSASLDQDSPLNGMLLKTAYPLIARMLIYSPK